MMHCHERAPDSLYIQTYEYDIYESVCAGDINYSVFSRTLSYAVLCDVYTYCAHLLLIFCLIQLRILSLTTIELTAVSEVRVLLFHRDPFLRHFFCTSLLLGLNSSAERVSLAHRTFSLRP
jgi:hypothetical protein